MNKKRLEEIAKQKGKILLCEETIVNVSKENIEVFETPVLMESTDGNQVRCRGVLKNVPVSKYTENDNSRIYNRSLWGNVGGTGVAEGSLSLMDHPEDEGSVKNICGVWKNMKLGEDHVLADWFLVGDNGQLLLEVVDAGGKIGISSVGYGEFLEDKKTVNPDTYELERLGDCVLNPSQNVYATKKNVINTEIKEEKDSFIEHKNTNNSNDTVLKEDNEEVNRMERFEELNFKNQVNAIIRESKKNPDVKEAIQILQETDVADHPQLTEKVQNTISELQTKLSEEKITAESNLSEVSTKYDELTAKYDVACESLDKLKENYTKAKVIIEKMGVKDGAKVSDVIKEKKELKISIKVMEENKRKMSSDIRQLIEDRGNMRSDIKMFLEDRKLMKADVKQLLEDRKNMLSDLKTLSEMYKGLKKKYNSMLKKMKEEGEVDEEPVEDEGYTFTFDDEDASAEEAIAEDDEEYVADEEVAMGDEDMDYDDEEVIAEDDEEYVADEVIGDSEIADEEVIMDEDDDEFVTDEVVADDEYADEEIIAEDDEEFVADDSEVGEDMDDDEEIIEEDDEEFEVEGEEEELVEEEEDVDISIEDEEEEVAPDPIQEKRKFVRSEINKIYLNEAKKYPAVKNIKKMVFNSKSISEAVNKISVFKESRKVKNDQPLKTKKVLAESVMPDWLKGRN